MSGINPNDPVVEMLKNLVQEYDKKLDDLAGGVQEAFRLSTEGNRVFFQHVLERLEQLEKRVNSSNSTELSK